MRPAKSVKLTAADYRQILAIRLGIGTDAGWDSIAQAVDRVVQDLKRVRRGQAKLLAILNEEECCE